MKSNYISLTSADGTFQVIPVSEVLRISVSPDKEMCCVYLENKYVQSVPPVQQFYMCKKNSLRFSEDILSAMMVFENEEKLKSQGELSC